MSRGRAPGVDATFAALADPTRRRVVELLRQGPRRASELAHDSGTSRPAMSRHLRVLRSGGLVSEQRGRDDGRARVYRLRREPFADLHHWLVELEAFWTDQLEAFQNHVERRGQRP